MALFCLLISVLILAGCAGRQADIDTDSDGFRRTDRCFLPADDGKPLTAAEQKAFFSEGDFDRRLTSAQLKDVLRHFKQLVHRERGTVVESVSRARNYLPMIRSVLRQYKLPAELAYLPFVESNYSVFVRSRSEALGMWQFIPSTASYYGMKFDAWTDERRDPLISTRTAAIYFVRLRDFFDGNWHLAISAYNAGEGKIRRGLDATGARTFFELRDRDSRIKDPRLKMTSENRQYLPKFLAVCKIMRNLKLLGFEPVGAAPAMASVSVKPGVELRQLAREAGMSWDTFLLHNAVYLRRYSPPDRHTTAVVPAARQKHVQAWLKTVRANFSYAAWRPYTIRQRDTLRSVAGKTGATQEELLRVNQLDGRNFRAGAVMLVPPDKKIPVRPAAKRIASASKSAAGNKKTASVTSSADARARELAARITGKTAAASERHSSSAVGTKKAASGKTAHSTYTVRKGDSIWSIARRLNIPPSELLAANGMTVKSAGVRPGDVLVIK